MQDIRKMLKLITCFYGENKTRIQHPDRSIDPTGKSDGKELQAVGMN